MLLPTLWTRWRRPGGISGPPATTICWAPATGRAWRLLRAPMPGAWPGIRTPCASCPVWPTACWHRDGKVWPRMSSTTICTMPWTKSSRPPRHGRKADTTRRRPLPTASTRSLTPSRPRPTRCKRPSMRARRPESTPAGAWTPSEPSWSSCGPCWQRKRPTWPATRQPAARPCHSARPSSGPSPTGSTPRHTWAARIGPRHPRWPRYTATT